MDERLDSTRLERERRQRERHRQRGVMAERPRSNGTRVGGASLIGLNGSADKANRRAIPPSRLSSARSRSPVERE
jgi:hypothetical protein